MVGLNLSSELGIVGSNVGANDWGGHITELWGYNEDEFLNEEGVLRACSHSSPNAHSPYRIRAMMRMMMVVST